MRQGAVEGCVERWQMQAQALAGQGLEGGAVVAGPGGHDEDDAPAGDAAHHLLQLPQQTRAGAGHQHHRGLPLAQHALQRLQPQVGPLLVNANTLDELRRLQD